jgi:hypothetical protein
MISAYGMARRCNSLAIPLSRLLQGVGASAIAKTLVKPQALMVEMLQLRPSPQAESLAHSIARKLDIKAICVRTISLKAIVRPLAAQRV